METLVKKMALYLLIALMGICASTSLGSTMVYTDETTFLGAIDSNYYLEEFNSYNNWGLIASPISLGPVNGWQYDVSTSFGSLWGLSTFTGCISTEWPDAVVTITPTGAQQVKAIGGRFFGSDWDGNLQAPTTIHIALSDGTVEEYSNTNVTDFRGFTSSVPITSLSISIPGNPHDVYFTGPYPTLDHMYVGVPEPATMSLLALGGVAMLLRRRK